MMYHVLMSLFFLCLLNTAAAQLREPLYAVPQSEVYSKNRVKELRVEVEQFSNNKVVHPRHVHQRHLLDVNGHSTRADYSTLTNQKMWSRLDTVFSSKGLPESSVLLQRDLTPGANTDSTALDQIKWMPYKRTRFAKNGKDKVALDEWNPVSSTWTEITTYSTYKKNDTTYTIEQELRYPSREIKRTYQLGTDKSITRTDKAYFSIHTHYGENFYYYSKADPKFYYYRTQNGRVTETGSVNFEYEMYDHLQTYPGDARGLLSSERRGNALMDKVSRLYPGTLKPRETYTYNAQGLLIEKKDYFNRTHTYHRDKDGKVLQLKVVFENQGLQTITYTYNNNGLLLSEINQVNGQPEENRYYQYWYY